MSCCFKITPGLQEQEMCYYLPFEGRFSLNLCGTKHTRNLQQTFWHLLEHKYKKKSMAQKQVRPLHLNQY